MKYVALFCFIILFGGMIFDGYENYKKNHAIKFKSTMSLLMLPDARLKSWEDGYRSRWEGREIKNRRNNIPVLKYTV